MRFRPPNVELSAETTYVLARAFGPPGAPSAAPLGAARLVATADALALSPRLGARVAPSRLRGEVPTEVALSWIHAHRIAAERARGFAALAAEVSARLGAAGLPLVLLKFAALDRGGYVRPGQRPASDVDVLVPADRIEEARRRLLAGGAFRELPAALPTAEHQGVPLIDENGRAVELHRWLPGVRPPGTRHFAGFRDLEQGRALLPEGSLHGCFLPTRELLVAHAIAHGIAQHGFAPRSYSLMRMVADVIDLGRGDPDEVAALAEGARPWLARDVEQDEVESVVGLCRHLLSGETHPSEPGPQRLLAHALAGSLDPAYAESLRLLAHLRAVSRGGRAGALLNAVREGVFLSDAQIDRIYGRPRTRWGYAARRWARPFDAGLRLARLWLRRTSREAVRL